MINSMNIVDANLEQTIALPESNETVVSSSIRVKKSTTEKLTAPCEVRVDMPALTVDQLSDAATMVAIVEESDDDSTFTTLATASTQTGAGGAGADAVSDIRVGLPTDVKQYIRLSITADTDLDASAVSGTIAVVVQL